MYVLCKYWLYSRTGLIEEEGDILSELGASVSGIDFAAPPVLDSESEYELGSEISEMDEILTQRTV